MASSRGFSARPVSSPTVRVISAACAFVSRSVRTVSRSSPAVCTTARGNPASARAARARSGSTAVEVPYSMTRPPVNSTPKSRPRTTIPEPARARTAAEAASQRRGRRIRYGFRRARRSRTAPVWAMPVSRGRRRTQGRAAAYSARTRVMTRALSMEARTPMPRVTPKPRTGPKARRNSRPAAMSVVTLESAIAPNAPRNPAVRDERGVGRRRAAYSSRARSKTSTLASIAMPMASTNPASPGRVRVAPRAARAA